MRKILSILAAAVAMDVAAQSVNTRTYNFVDVTAQATWTKPQAVTWYQAETVQLNERFATNLTLDVDATNLLMVWEVVARTNPATAYIVSTGTVVSAASNYVRWTVGPTNSNLAAGQYRGFVRALEVSGTNLVNVGVLAVQDIAVNASPDSRYYAFQGPLSYSLAGALTGLVVDGVAASITGQTAYANTAGGGGAITSIVRGAGSSTRLSVSNGVGPIVTLNLDVSGLATGTPVYSLSGYATGTPVYAETDPRWQAGTGALWSAINSKGTGTVGSLSGVAMQGGTYTGDVRAATSAGGALANMSGSNVLTWGMGGGTAVALSGALTINGGSTVATGTPVYAESDPVWVGASNLYYTKVLADAKFATGTPVYVESDPLWAAVSNLFRIGTNVVSDMSGTNLAYNGVPLRDGVGSGGGSYLPLSGGSMTGPITGSTYYVTNSGAAAISVSGVRLFIYNTNAPGDILYSNGDTELDMNGGDIDGVSDLQVVTISAVPLSPYVQMNSTLNGEGFACSNFVFYGDGLGLTNLWIVSPDNQYLNTNDIPRQFGWIGGQRNRFLPGLFQPGGTNVFGLVGGGGYSNSWLMTTAQGAALWGGMSNSALSDVSGAASVGGFNNFLNGAIGGLMGGGRGNTMSGNYSAMLAGQGGTMAGAWSVMGGRENVGAANYTTTFGYQNQNQSGAQVSTIAGGSTNVIAGAFGAFIGAGTRNLIGSGGTYSFIGAGTTNQALGQGQFVGGNSAVASSTATNAFLWNGAQSGYTNSTPRSAAFNVPGGFMISGGGSYGADSQQGISVTNLLLRSDGVSVYTQIVVRGIIIQ